MKSYSSISSAPAKDLGRQQIRIDIEHVPDFLRTALQSDEVQEVTAALIETVRKDPRDQPRATPVASPGAPYSRHKAIR